MAANWLSSLKHVPWSKVLVMAPTIVENGRKLWDKVGKRKADEIPGNTTSDRKPLPIPDALAAIELRLNVLEGNSAQLREEAVASFDVVRSMAEQHSELVYAVDVLLVRTLLLVRVCILLGIVSACLLALVLSR